MEADMMKNTVGLNRWVASRWYFKVCWLHSRCPFSHYSFFFVCASQCEIWEEAGGKKPSWLNTHIRNIHGFRFWHHEDRSPHISLLPCSSSFSFLLLFIVYCCPRIRWQGCFLHFSALDTAVIWFKYIGRSGGRTVFFIPIIYARTHKAFVCLWYILWRPLYRLMCFHHPNFAKHVSCSSNPWDDLCGTVFEPCLRKNFGCHMESVGCWKNCDESRKWSSKMIIQR